MSKLSRALWWRDGKRKESLQLCLWNLNICIEKVNAKCWLAEMTLVMMPLPLEFVFFNVCWDIRSQISIFFFGHHFINYPNLLFWWCIDIVRRISTLVTLGTQSLTCIMDLEKPRTYFIMVKVVQSFPRKSSKFMQSYESKKSNILSKTRSNELTFIKTLYKNVSTLYLLMESSNIFTCRFCKTKTCDKETSSS